MCYSGHHLMVSGHLYCWVAGSSNVHFIQSMHQLRRAVDGTASTSYVVCRLFGANISTVTRRQSPTQRICAKSTDPRPVGIDPHTVRCLMVWAWICAVSWWWMPTLNVSCVSPSLVEGQRTPVVEHGEWEGDVTSLFRWVEFSLTSCSIWSYWHARRPSTRVAASRLKAGGAISANTGSWSTWVGRKHPVMVRRAALRLTSTRRVWVLLHYTGAQHSAGAYTSARMDVLNIGVLAPQLVPARLRINAVHAMTLRRSAVRWSRYVSVLSSFPPR